MTHFIYTAIIIGIIWASIDIIKQEKKESYQSGYASCELDLRQVKN